MSDNKRWRYGDTNPVVAAVDSATVIEIFDLLWQGFSDEGPPRKVAYPASEFKRDDGNDGSATELASDLQDAFAGGFLGVAMKPSRSGDTAPIPVATTGVFEFDCHSSTFELGDLVGVIPYSTGEASDLPHPYLENQRVVKVNGPILAIARVGKREPIATTSVLVDIRSTIMTGGIEGSSPRGV